MSSDPSETSNPNAGNPRSKKVTIDKPDLKNINRFKNPITYLNKMTEMADYVVYNANDSNDWGFDISNETKYSPYRGKQCTTDPSLNTDIERMRCASAKYLSRIGTSEHRRKRREKYKDLIATLCKNNKSIACGRDKLPVHNICNCDMKVMTLKDTVLYALNFYTDISNLITNPNPDEDGTIEKLRKGKDSLVKTAKKLKTFKSDKKQGEMNKETQKSPPATTSAPAPATTSAPASSQNLPKS